MSLCFSTMSKATYRGIVYDTKEYATHGETKLVQETYRGVKFERKVRVVK